MAKEEGTVVKLIGNKPFGFIRRPDGTELFFHFSKYPSGQKPAQGDELEYEVQTDSSKPAGKQDFAAAIVVVKKVSVSAPSPKAATQTTVSVSAGPLDAVVNIMYDIQEFKSTTEVFELPVVVKVTDPSGKPIRGAYVVLWANGSKFEAPDGPGYYTNQYGQVDYLVAFDRTIDSPTGQPGPELSITRLLLVAKVTFGGKELVINETIPRSQNMTIATPLPTPKATTPSSSQPNPLPIELDIAQGKRIVGDVITFVTKPCKGQVRVVVSPCFSKLINLATGEESATSPVIWGSDDTGVLNVKIVTMECHHTVTGALANDKMKTATAEVYDV